MAAGKTMMVARENSRFAWRIRASTWTLCSFTRSPLPTATRFEGGQHGTSLPSQPLQCEEMGRNRRGLSYWHGKVGSSLVRHDEEMEEQVSFCFWECCWINKQAR